MAAACAPSCTRLRHTPRRVACALFAIVVAAPFAASCVLDCNLSPRIGTLDIATRHASGPKGPRIGIEAAPTQLAPALICRQPASAGAMTAAARAAAARALAARDYKGALQAALSLRKDDSEELVELVDTICMHSAATGEVLGFDGRLLEVRPASPDAAWLGAAAPAAAAPAPRPGQLEFTSIEAALEAARDGDVLQLMPGTHVVSQVTLAVSKRVLITGAVGSTPQQVVLDHRANHPCFSISRSCILRSFSIDMVGFCEAVAISSPRTSVKPIIQSLSIACSGDDGVSVGGKAQPLLQNCTIQARHAGVRQCDAASTTLWRCTIRGGQHAVVAAGESLTFCDGCKLEDCDQEGVLGLQRARLDLANTDIAGCGGPALDMSDDSSASLKHVDIERCSGGIWLWHKSSCEAVCCHINGGGTYAVLLDAEAYARGSSCTVEGPCHVCDDEGGEGGESSSSSQSSPTVAGRLSRAALKASAGGSPGSATCSRHSSGGTSSPGSSRPLALNPAGILAGAACPASGRSSERMETDTPGPQRSWAGAASPLAPSPAAGLPASEPLVREDMRVSDAAMAAALFPAEEGAFACEPPGPLGRGF